MPFFLRTTAFLYPKKHSFDVFARTRNWSTRIICFAWQILLLLLLFSSSHVYSLLSWLFGLWSLFFSIPLYNYNPMHVPGLFVQSTARFLDWLEARARRRAALRHPVRCINPTCPVHGASGVVCSGLVHVVHATPVRLSPMPQGHCVAHGSKPATFLFLPMHPTCPPAPASVQHQYSTAQHSTAQHTRAT